MPIVGAFITIAIQVGAAYKNYTTNKKTVAEIKRLQRENRKVDLEHGHKRNTEKFRASCEFQYEMEAASHKQRLNDINEDFINSFELIAHGYAMNNYPLMISPYFISKSVIAKCGTELDNFRQELLCILTNSNDVNFNALVYPEIDIKVNEVISEHWNQKSLHTICYYPEIWNQNHLYSDEQILNLQANIKTPTISITPYFVKDKEHTNIEIKVNFWNRADNNTSSSRLSFGVPTGIEITKPLNMYTDDERNLLISKLFNFIICIIGIQADLHYWATSYQPPFLPYLISTGKIDCEDSIKDGCINSYIESFKTLVLGQVDSSDSKMDLIRDLSEITLYNFPERSVDFIKSVTLLTGDKPITSTLLTETLLSIFKTRTDIAVSSTSEIDSKFLAIDDIKIISTLIEIAQSCRCFETVKEFTEVIRKRIFQI